jgi:hypothetical protein
MSDQLKKSSKGRRTVTRAKSPAFVTIYANNVELNVSPWDFKFRLGHVSDITDELFSVEETAHVYMSPPHAKAFLKILSGALKKYEETFGKIIDVEIPGGKPTEVEPPS